MNEMLQVPITINASQVAKLTAIGSQAAEAFPSRAGSQQTSELSWAVLAAFQVLLARYSRQEDVTIGTTQKAGDHEAKFFRLAKLLFVVSGMQQKLQQI